MEKMFSSADEFFMRRAQGLAVKGRGWVEPNPMVGCVIIRSTEKKGNSSGLTCVRNSLASEKELESLILGEGYHQRYGGAHAEVNALKAAESRGYSVHGSTVYVTLEPCCHYGKTPPCTESLIQAGVKRVVASMTDPFPRVSGSGIMKLRAAGIQVETGLLEQESRKINAPYLKRENTGIPWVIGKWGSTLDGKIACYSGSSRWITSEASQRRVHELRSRVDAILVGSRTVLADNPMLNVRGVNTPPRIPIRVVLDSTLVTPLECKLVQTAREIPTVLCVGPDISPEEIKPYTDLGCEVLHSDYRTHEERLEYFLRELCKRGVTNILAEGGGGLLGSLLDLGQLDEVCVFIAPKLVGGSNAPTAVAGHGIEWMNEALCLDMPEISISDGDVCISGRIKRKQCI